MRWQTSRSDEGRTLVTQENGGEIEANYGITGKGLDPVALTVEAWASSIRISFKTSSENTVILLLVNEDWLSGTMVLTGDRGGSDLVNRPMDLQRKK